MKKSKKQPKISKRVLKARAAQRAAAKRLRKKGWVHPQIGTHLSRRFKLNPNHPEPKPPGERRGVGTPPIRTPILNAISYTLRNEFNARILTHHETTTAIITREHAEAFIRMWLGLPPEDYCKVVKVAHTFLHDVPTLTMEKE